MITFIILFFLLVAGVAAYFVVISARKRKDATETRPPANLTARAKVGRASGSGDD